MDEPEATPQELLRYLEKVRKALDIAKADLESDEEVFQNSEVYQTYLKQKATVDSLLVKESTLKDQIKALAVETSEATGYTERHPFPFVTIKEFKVVQITDEKAALSWVAANAPDLLSYNQSKLNKIVVNLPSLSWVKLDKEYKAEIASSFHLE